MIQPLRTYHRRVFLALAVALPVVLVAGLTSRHQAVVSAHPKAQGEGYVLVSEDQGHWQHQQIRIQIFSAADTTERWVQLNPTHEVVAPDVLVYWSENLPQQSSLPANARLLGSLDPSAYFPLPETASAGFLILYSPAQKSVLDATAFGGRP